MEIVLRRVLQFARRALVASSMFLAVAVAGMGWLIAILNIMFAAPAIGNDRDTATIALIAVAVLIAVGAVVSFGMRRVRVSLSLRVIAVYVVTGWMMLGFAFWYLQPA